MRCAVWLLVGLSACRFGFDKRAPDGNAGSGDVLLDDGGTPIPAFEPYWTSGSRLRARLLTPVEGGDPYFLGWYDTVLQTGCTSGVAADGIERCVAQDLRTAQFWSDAACTQPLVWVRPATCGSAAYAHVTDTSGRFHVHPVGAVFPGQLYEDTGTCVTASTPLVGEVRVLGTEVPASMLVPTSYMNVMVGDFQRPTQGHIDGSAVETGALGVPAGSCFPTAGKLGPSPCVATSFRGIPVYRDALCTQRAYLWRRNSYDPPTTSELAVYDTADACESSYQLITTTGDVTAGVYYRNTSTGCTMTTTGALDKMYTGSVSTAVYPTGSLVVGPRRGRLGYLYWVGSDNVPMAVRYWDHELRQPCLPINDTAGKLRCMPTSLNSLSAYSGSNCTGPPQTVIPACFGEPPVRGPTYTSCIDFFQVKVQPFVATTMSRFDDTCSVLSPMDGFYDPIAPGGAEVPSSMFAEMTEVIE